MRTWLHQKLWNLCAYNGWTAIREWHQRTCPHPKWNTYVWGDIHCNWCGQTKKDSRVDAFMRPVIIACYEEAIALNKTEAIAHWEKIHPWLKNS
jgi:hypothetical protein